MLGKVYIQADIVCLRNKKCQTCSIPVVVYEEDGVPLYPPQSSGCPRGTLSDPCPECFSHVLNKVYDSLPLPNRSTLEVIPPMRLIEEKLREEGML